MKKFLIFTLLVPSLFLSSCDKKQQKNPGNSEDIPATPSGSEQGGEEQHSHNWSSTWSNDENYHWHACSGCTEKGELAPHAFGDWQVVSESKEERTCNVCGYKEEKNHQHTYSTAWAYNELTHWHASTCGHNVKDNEAPHTFNNENICTVCGYQQHVQQGVSVLTSFPRTSAYVKYFGRNYHYHDKVIMNNIASGFEVTFYGTELTATLDADFGSWYGKTTISIFVDGEKDPTLRSMTLEYGSQVYDYRIVSGLTEGQHTVKVLKRTEDLVTRMSLHKLATDGYFIEKQPDNRLKMEVYGDSITCGYGNLRGALSDTTSSAYQDGLETYATLAAFTLDADINVFARSGGGLYTCYGYTTGTNSLVKDNFTKTDYQGTYPWNMSYFTPDVVIINIGTNDYWWPSTATGSDIWGNSYHGNYNDATFKAEYVAFVKQLVSYYGNNTSFILCSGFMESAVDSRVQDIQTTLQSEITNTVLRHQFAQCGEGHPKVHEHAVGAAEIVNLIRDNNLDTPVNTQTTNMTEFDGESSGKYSISAHSNSSSIVSVSDNSITIHNENWMAGFVLDSTNRGSTFNMTMNIGAASQSSYVANVVYGVLPYYIDDDNYIIVYLQFSSATKMKNIGCTGRIDGKDTGWLDFFGINDIVINDWTDFGEISINREYNRLNVKYGGKVQNKYIPGMVKSSEKTGYYACSEVDASFTNIEYGEIKELIPDPVAPVYPTTTYEYVGSGSMDIDGDDVVLHNGTWKDAFALRTLSLGTSYTFSATITANKDEFTTADDAMFGIVLNYESASEYTLLMINFGDYTGKVGNKVRCITILDWYDGVDHWADFWTFQGKETHFTTGETLTVVKNGGSITATFAGTTETVSLPHIADASALTAGFYSQKTGYTRYSNISWTH